MSPRVLTLAALLVGGCALLDFDPASRPYRDDVVSAPDVVTVNDVVSAPDVVTVNDVVSAPDVVTANDVVSAPDVVTVNDVVSAPDVVTADDVAVDVAAAGDGGCSAGCPLGLSCVNGACGCPTGLLDCGGDRPTRCRACCRNADCDDRNGCTTDRCESGGRCTRIGCGSGEVCCNNTQCCQGSCSGRCQ